jgi:hypothetical protein
VKPESEVLVKDWEWFDLPTDEFVRVSGLHILDQLAYLLERRMPGSRVHVRSAWRNLLAQCWEIYDMRIMMVEQTP